MNVTKKKKVMLLNFLPLHFQFLGLRFLSDEGSHRPELLCQERKNKRKKEVHTRDTEKWAGREVPHIHMSHTLI